MSVGMMLLPGAAAFAQDNALGRPDVFENRKIEGRERREQAREQKKSCLLPSAKTFVVSLKAAKQIDRQALKVAREKLQADLKAAKQISEKEQRKASMEKAREAFKQSREAGRESWKHAREIAKEKFHADRESCREAREDAETETES